jgi:branched-chain amino acid transport system substrate-binding protein
MSVALSAITKTCKKDRAAILGAVFATKNYSGVLGRWSFDANGDMSLRDMAGNRVEKGKWVKTGVLKFP